eukprot:9477575-Karenia_brevis.AAC.1
MASSVRSSKWRSKVSASAKPACSTCKAISRTRGLDSNKSWQGHRVRLPQAETACLNAKSGMYPRLLR